MNHKRKRQLIGLIFLIIGATVAVALVIFALGQNVNLYYTTTQVANNEVPKERTFRLGGIVVPGSIKREEGSLGVEFTLTDTANNVVVYYQGILPDLFREGQGIVAQGQLNEKNEFVAHEVLAKHDEEYMPPAVKQALEQAAQ